jgi:hypothetical protein
LSVKPVSSGKLSIPRNCPVKCVTNKLDEFRYLTDICDHKITGKLNDHLQFILYLLQEINIDFTGALHYQYEF